MPYGLKQDENLNLYKIKSVPMWNNRIGYDNQPERGFIRQRVEPASFLTTTPSETDHDER